MNIPSTGPLGDRTNDKNRRKPSGLHPARPVRSGLADMI
jgi:hypothetical protein